MLVMAKSGVRTIVGRSSSSYPKRVVRPLAGSMPRSTKSVAAPAVAARKTGIPLDSTRPRVSNRTWPLTVIPVAVLPLPA